MFTIMFSCINVDAQEWSGSIVMYTSRFTVFFCFFFFISSLIPFTVRTHGLQLQSGAHVNRNHSHRRVLTMVNSSRGNRSSLGSCSEPGA